MTSKFAYDAAKPHHLSVGALLVNGEGNVAVQAFDTVTISDTHETLTDVVTLMRTTLLDNESLEDAVHRGLMREFGATGTIDRYLGHITARIPREGGAILKTTLYFLVQCDAIDYTKRSVGEDEYESSATLAWYTPHELVEKMKHQTKGSEREDFNEALVVERLLA